MANQAQEGQEPGSSGVSVTRDVFSRALLSDDSAFFHLDVSLLKVQMLGRKRLIVLFWVIYLPFRSKSSDSSQKNGVNTVYAYVCVCMYVVYKYAQICMCVWHMHVCAFMYICVATSVSGICV